MKDELFILLPTTILTILCYIRVAYEDILPLIDNADREGICVVLNNYWRDAQRI